jgi:peptidoglycan hydrolase-like protein with peptidoglycan-binding domain/phage head maturation protease
VGEGETGKRVSDLQKRLNALGAKPPLKTDGVFGPKTLAAVRAFQKAHGLKVDGLVGPKTTASLRLPGKPGAKPAGTHKSGGGKTPGSESQKPGSVTHAQQGEVKKLLAERKVSGPDAADMRDQMTAMSEADAGALIKHLRSLPAKPASRMAHEPIGKPGGPGLWHVKGMQLPAYIQHIRNDIMAGGTPESQATRLAIGICRNFAAGHDGKGNKVSAATQAKAVAAMAEFERERAKAKATRSTVMATDTYDADGLDESWDSDHGDLPDLTGLDVAGLEAAEAALGMTPDPGEVARSQPPLGQGGRFAKLKAALAAKGVKNPDALAAHIGRRKYGKAKFGKLAAKASSPAMASRAGELFRTWPLEECRIMRTSEGHEYGSGRVVEAYAAVYGQPTEIHDHEGHYIEDIDDGAFGDALRAAHPDRNGGYWGVTCLYNHGMTVHGTPAERFSLPPGVPRHVSSEGKGLLTRTEYAKTPLGDELLELVDMGALRTQSFTGGIFRSDPMLRGPGDRYRARGGMLQRVRRLVLGLREYGLTPFAAYTGAEVLGVRMQLPGSFEPDPAEFEEGDGPEPAATGIPPADGSATRSTGSRLYQLRTQELLEKAGIELPH